MAPPMQYVIRYIIGDKKGIMLIIKLMHGKVRTPKNKRFNDLIKIFNSKYSLEIPESLLDISNLTNNSWFTGFTSFHISNLVKTTTHNALFIILCKLYKFQIVFMAVKRPWYYINIFNSSSPAKQSLAYTVRGKEDRSKALKIAFLPIKEISSLIIIPPYQNSIFISLLLSGGWYVCSRKNNSLGRIKFRQPYFNREYVNYVYEEIYPYCAKDPYRFISDNTWKGKPADDILIATK